MIWVKRIAPFLLILLLWFAYRIYTQLHESAQANSDGRIARLSAQSWMASARYRENPQEFQKFRDSLLHANGLDDVSMKKYVNSIERDPDRQLAFSIILSRTVDSLSKIEDSTRKANTPVKSNLPAGSILSPTAAHDSLMKVVDERKVPVGKPADTTRRR